MSGAGGASPGLLLAFEGVDGCGKSTQVELCARWLTQQRPARRVTVLREPGSSVLGERLRDVLLHGEPIGACAEMLLYMAARAELYEQSVLPALAAGDAVVLDRSHYSTAAYQGFGLGLPVDEILALAQRVTAGRDPDRVVLLDLPPERAAERLGGRDDTAHDRIERRDGSYFRRVAQGFRELARREPARFRVVPAEGSVEQVAAAVREVLADVA